MKRRHHHPMMSSEEDVGLPKSPVSPQRKERTINNSAGSLSMLSMTSSDIDEERSNSTFGGGFFDSSQSSGYYNRTTSDVSRNSDEVGECGEFLFIAFYNIFLTIFLKFLLKRFEYVINNKIKPFGCKT